MKILLYIPLLFLAFSANASFTLAKKGKTDCVIVQQADAIAPEIKAAEELASTLEQITGAKFIIQTNGTTIPEHAIIIGPGKAAAQLFPDIPFDKLGADEIVMRTKGNRLLLAGGRTRGTIYSVYRFLQEQCGVRYWTSWATDVPKRASLKIKDLNVRYAPPFEYRGPFWFPAFEQKWKVHNQSNSENSIVPPELGGCIKYKGFCHTFNALVPPDKYFATHPEWFSLVKGQRTHVNAQLCLTNPKLRDFVVDRVKEWLRESPDCEIVSVTQNDCFGFCECPDCKALDDAEGSHAGTMLSFANYIAEKIETDFPKVAIDTFAYQYTRKPPKTLKARPNVIVRLCSIECNFREPLDHPSNAAFADDIQKWSKICQRLYIWDYVTDFSAYIFPHPNWFVLGPNMRFFEKYNVKGVFEEGAYAGHGAEMAELRSWVLAQLMWNPHQDDKKLTREFLDGYYGKEAAEKIAQYLQLMHDGSKDFFLACYLRKDPPPYCHFQTLGVAEKLWQEAEAAVKDDPEKSLRVRIAHLPVRCAFLKNWTLLRHECWEQNLTWPLSESRKAVAEEFRTVCAGVPEKDWTHVSAMSEGGLKVEDFVKNFAEDPKPIDPPPPVRLKHPAPPSDLKNINAKKCIDLQDNMAGLAGFGKWAKVLPSEGASDLRAVWMPGDHSEWAFRVSGNSLPPKARTGKWKVYAVIRVKKNESTKGSPDSVAFMAGVYDNVQKNHPADFKAKLSDVNNDYHSYLLGGVEFNADRDIYVSPASNPDVKAIWVDRIFLVPASN